MPAPKKKAPVKKAPTEFWAHLFYADCMNYDRSFKSLVSQEDAVEKAKKYVADGDSNEGQGEYVVFTGLGIHFEATEPDSNELDITDSTPSASSFDW